jgi:hypothetical protein
MKLKGGHAEMNRRRQEAFEEGIHAAQNMTDKEIVDMAKKYDDPQEKLMFLDGVKTGKQRSN